METRRLDELCVQITDCPHSTPQWLSSGKLVLRNFNIHNGRIDLSNVSYTDDETFFARNKRATPIPGDIVMSREAPMGEVAIIPNGFECCLGQRMVLLHPDATVCNGKFLMYSLLSPFVQKQIKRSDTTGSVVSNLCIPDLCALEIPYVNIERQECIVALLSDIDAKIDNNNAIAAELEGMAKDLYDYWFVQFDFPDENGKPYKSSGGKMVWNEELKREIPEGWEATNIGAITICHDSERIPVSGEKRKMMIGSIPYYGATEIMGHVNRAIFNGDYVLLAEDGSVMDDSGHPIIQRISGPSWVNNHAHVLEPEKTYSCRLLMMILKDIPVVQIKTGSIQWKINQENLNKYKIANIPSALRALAVLKLEPIDSMLLDLKKENEELTSLRDFLLPMLLNGQVKVKGA